MRTLLVEPVCGMVGRRGLDRVLVPFERERVHHALGKHILVTLFLRSRVMVIVPLGRFHQRFHIQSEFVRTFIELASLHLIRSQVVLLE